MNEKENTFRTLKDQPLAVSSLWCYFGVHNWSKYTEVMKRVEGGYHIDYQTRHCIHCNKLDLFVIRRVMI